MVDTVLSPPLLPGHRYPMSREEYLALPETEGLLVEWVDGEAIVFMSVLMRHADLGSLVFTLLSAYVNLRRLGKVYSESFAVSLTERSAIRKPDIFVVLSEHVYRIQREGFVGAADLIVEIISDDSPRRDRKEKFEEYQAEGVPEYLWIESRDDITGYGYFRLDDHGTYQPVPPDSAGRCHSDVIPGFWFDPRWFEQDPLPNPMDLLREIAPDVWR